MSCWHDTPRNQCAQLRDKKHRLGDAELVDKTGSGLQGVCVDSAEREATTRVRNAAKQAHEKSDRTKPQQITFAKLSSPELNLQPHSLKTKCARWKIRLNCNLEKPTTNPDFTFTGQKIEIRQTMTFDKKSKFFPTKFGNSRKSFFFKKVFLKKYWSAPSWPMRNSYGDSCFSDRSLLVTILLQPDHHIGMYALHRKRCRILTFAMLVANAWQVCHVKNFSGVYTDYAEYCVLHCLRKDGYHSTYSRRVCCALPTRCAWFGGPTHEGTETSTGFDVSLRVCM